jgi:hypothetical protein
MKLLCLVFQLLRPPGLKETEHFRGWRHKKVAKIVQCGEKIRKGGLKLFSAPSVIERLFFT